MALIQPEAKGKKTPPFPGHSHPPCTLGIQVPTQPSEKKRGAVRTSCIRTYTFLGLQWLSSASPRKYLELAATGASQTPGPGTKRGNSISGITNPGHFYLVLVSSICLAGSISPLGLIYSLLPKPVFTLFFLSLTQHLGSARVVFCLLPACACWFLSTSQYTIGCSTIKPQGCEAPERYITATGHDQSRPFFSVSLSSPTVPRSICTCLSPIYRLELRLISVRFPSLGLCIEVIRFHYHHQQPPIFIIA